LSAAQAQLAKLKAVLDIGKATAADPSSWGRKVWRLGFAIGQRKPT
jgi:hypothetical protein